MVTSSATTQAQTQGSEVAHPKIYVNCKWLEFMKGPVLLIQTCRISMTQAGQRQDTLRKPGEDPGLMVSQKPEILNLTNDSSQWIFAREDMWTRVCTVRHTVTHCSFHNQMFSYVFVFCLWLLFCGGRLQEQRAFMRG